MSFRDQMKSEGRSALETLDRLSGRDTSTLIDLQKIRLDGGTQPRAALDKDLIQEYAAAMVDGDEFPPVVVFYDGTAYWLADGFHRFHAAHRIGRKEIRAEVRQGTQRDAVLHSVGVNAAHGKRRSNADKRRAVMTLLADAEWAEWSDREIARRCKVSHQFVNNVRKELSVNDLQMDTGEEGLSVYDTQMDDKQRERLAYYLSYPAAQIIENINAGTWEADNAELVAMLDLEAGSKQRQMVLTFLRQKIAQNSAPEEEGPSSQITKIDAGYQPPAPYTGPYAYILNCVYPYDVKDAVMTRFKEREDQALEALPEIIRLEREGRNRRSVIAMLELLLGHFEQAVKAAVDVETVQQAQENVQSTRDARKVQRGGTTYEQQTGSEARRKAPRTTYAPIPGERQQTGTITLEVRDEDDAREVVNQLFKLLAEDAGGVYAVTIRRAFQE